MKLQDRFPYDDTLLGLEGKYQPIGDDGFLINSNCIMVKDHVVKTGSTYFFFEDNERKAVRATAVKLVDAFYYLDMVYLLLIDVFCGQVRLLNHTLDNGLTLCKWKLVDTNSVETLMDAKEKKRSNNDLLEFDF